MHKLNNAIPGPSFNAPLEMLQACHERIMDQCSTLQKLLQHLPAHGCDLQARQAAQAILRYFNTAGQFHHQDEELDLFPRLQAVQNADASELIKHLLGEHRAMEMLWQRLDEQLLAIADGSSATLQADLVNDFTQAYALHIGLENTRLFPLAEQLLSARQLLDVGQRMAKRRGVLLP
jgi:hemerythrin-like domain-containing protein